MNEAGHAAACTLAPASAASDQEAGRVWQDGQVQDIEHADELPQAMTHAPGCAQLSGRGPVSWLNDSMRPERCGRAPGAAQVAGRGPDRALPDSMMSVRFWKAPEVAQVAGRGPVRLASVMERMLRAGKELLEAQVAGRVPVVWRGQRDVPACTQ